ncbi:MAG: glycosyl amidation-associated protein WbuZ [Planctomycetota bacterium]
MIKTRVIPCLLVTELMLVKTVKFGVRRPIGVPRPAVRIFNAREVDELILLDIDATPEKRGPSLDLVADLAEECYMPLTIGGGVGSVEEVRSLLKKGADKVAINTKAFERPELISEASGTFGSQCIVVAIDARRREGGGYEAYVRGGTEATGLDPVAWAKRVEALGAGEILLTSIDRDGTMEGYDLELTRQVADVVRIPVVACGGAGRPEDFVDVVLRGHASAVAAGSIFQYTQTTPRSAKQVMRGTGIDVRL